jgi:antirestriction protein ArdC
MAGDGCAGTQGLAGLRSRVLEDRRPQRGGGEEPQVGPAPTEGPASEEEKATTRPVFARAYTVFNSAQVEGYTPTATPILPEAVRIERAERFCANLGIETRHGGSRAF